jgi:hypothetical protein
VCDGSHIRRVHKKGREYSVSVNSPGRVIKQKRRRKKVERKTNEVDRQEMEEQQPSHRAACVGLRDAPARATSDRDI